MKRPLKALIAAILPATLAFSALMSACTDSHTHTLTPVAAKEATCTEAGNIAYWFCDDCDKYFSDAEAENEITQAQTVISALGHKWSALWTGGAQGHWHECDVCHEADSVVAHADANTDGVCDVCGYTISAEDPDDPIAVEGITLDKTTATVEEGATVTLTATVTPDNATDKTVTWSTSNEAIATVSGGVVTGVKAGEVTITAKAGDKSATCTVTVTAKQSTEDPDDPIVVTGITLDKTTATVEEGATVTLTATVTPDNATDKTVTWSTSNEAIATVSGGVVTGVKAGEVTITAKAGDKSATCTVTVTAATTEPEVVPVTGVTLNQTAVTLDIDQSITLTAAVAPENATNKAVTWASDKTDVATVDSNGKVTAVAAGTANITVTTADGGKTATCAVTVNPATEPGTDPSEEYEKVVSVLDIQSGIDITGGKGSGYPIDETTGITIGKFTLMEGYFDSSSSRFGGELAWNNQEGLIKFTLGGRTNSISFLALNGSSSAQSNMATLYLVGEDGTRTKVNEVETVASPHAVVEWTDLAAGNYEIETVKSVRFSGFSVTEELAVSEPVSIESSSSNTEFLVGDDMSAATLARGLKVSLNYENGRVDTLTSSQYTVTAPTVNGAGTYSVKVTATIDGVKFEDEYSIDVYSIAELSIGNYVMDDGNTKLLQTLFLEGGEFNCDNLVVVAIGELTGKDPVKFTLAKDDDYTVTAPDLSASGEKTVTIQTVAGRDAATASYKINVVKNVFTSPKGTYTVNVNAAGTVAVSDGNVTFTGINDALKYFEITGVPSSAAKVINVAEGEYKEKVEVTLPNVSIIGSGTSDYDSKWKTVIWFDAISGKTDPSGASTHGTDGSATISIRESATGFYAENIMFKNYYNTDALYNESKKISSDTQAVAALIEAEEAVFNNVGFSSYHDTLYARTGTHYFYDCYIEGRTDFIFGEKATAYFDSCSIYSIGAGLDEENGGYVVALKPANSGNYFVFNKCLFDGDDNVKPGSVALGRAWGPDMKLVIMNSTMTEVISTAAHTAGISQAQRYVTMSGNEPDPDNMIEYNNSGAGSVTSSIENTCTVIDGATAANYELSAVFTDWNPSELVGSDKVAVTRVTLDKETLELTVGEGTAQLVATIAPEGATDTRLVWLSSDEKVATVDENGVVTPVGEGEATITVVTVDGNFSDTCAVTVNAADPSQAVTFSGILDDYMVALTEIGTGLQGNTVYYFNTDGTITTDANATTGIISFLGNNSSVEVRSGTATSADGSKEFNNFMNMGGSSNSSRRQFIVDLSDYVGRQVTITAYAATGSGGKARPVYIYDDSSKLGKADGVAVSAGQTDQKTLDVVTYTVTVSETTTYYVGCVENIRIYGVVVDII